MLRRLIQSRRHKIRARKLGRCPQIESLEDRCLLAIFTVNSSGDAADSGNLIADGVCDTGGTIAGQPECTLRAAIDEANLSIEADEIRFNIGGGGTQRIVVGDSLEVRSPLTIDATTQPGFEPNRTPIIELTGATPNAFADGLSLNVSYSYVVTTVRGLVLNNFRYAINVSRGSVMIERNFIGTDVAGTQAVPNSIGIRISSENTSNRIGGPNADQGNLISGNTVGVDIGRFAGPTIIQRNLIGTAWGGIVSLPNSSEGILVHNSNNQITENLIAFNRGDGVVVDDEFFEFVDTTPTANRISGNSIHSNGAGSARMAGIVLRGTDAQGASLGRLNIIPNDPGDVDQGPNGLQNFPILTSATTNSGGNGTITVNGFLNSTPNTEFSLEFFLVRDCDASDFGEGETLVGMSTVMTDNLGDIDFRAELTPLPGIVGLFENGYSMTATATGPDGTSEFSRCIRAGLEISRFENLFVSLAPRSVRRPVTQQQQFVLSVFSRDTGVQPSESGSATWRVVRGIQELQRTVLPIEPSSTNISDSTFSYANVNAGTDVVEVRAMVAATLVTLTADVEWFDPGAANTSCTLDPSDVAFPTGTVQTLIVTVISGGQPASGTDVTFTAADFVDEQPGSPIVVDNKPTNSTGQAALIFGSIIERRSLYTARGEIAGEPFLCEAVVAFEAAPPKLILDHPTLNLGGRIVTVTAKVVRVTSLNTEFPVSGVPLDMRVERSDRNPLAATDADVTDLNGIATFTYPLAPLDAPFTDAITVTGISSAINLREVITQQWISDCLLAPGGPTVSLGQEVSVFAAAGYRKLTEEALDYPTTFRVVEGPNAGRQATDTSFRYTSNTPGMDRIEASIQVDEIAFTCLSTTIEWRQDDTPTGSDVLVRPVDATTGTTPVSITFAGVVEAGRTTIVTTPSSQQAPTPNGFRLVQPGVGGVRLYFDIDTTATFDGPVQVCVELNLGFSFSNNVFLQHFVDGEWEEIGSSRFNDAAEPVCGEADSLSPFAIFEPLPAGNVTVRMLKKRLIIEGDAENNAIRIEEGSTANSWRITGEDTRINGGTATVEINRAIRVVQIMMGDGNDSIAFQGGAERLDFGGKLQVNLGDGDDSIEFNSASLTGPLSLDAATGSDRLDLIDTVLSGKVQVLLGDGPDAAISRNSSLPSRLLLDTGNDGDIVRMADSIVAAGIKARITGGDGTTDSLDVGMLVDPNSKRNQFDPRLRLEGFENQLS